MILPPTSEISHQHKVTNITMSPTSLSPYQKIKEADCKDNETFLLFNFSSNQAFQLYSQSDHLFVKS